MTQFYSRNDVNYSGDVYSIPFKYIHKKEVKVYIDDELWTKWHFLNTNQLTLDEVPEGIGYNNIVSVRRETDIKEKVVTYDNNSLLNKENLNKSQDQLIYAVQEIYDNNTQFAIDIRAEVDEKVERVSNAVEQLEALNDAVETAVNASLIAEEKVETVTQKEEEITQTINQATQEISQQAALEKAEIDNLSNDLKESIKDLTVLTTLEIGDIGFTQMAIDESKGKRRILNGQLIIQEQYVQFTNIIKNSVALNPSIACTETEWQTEVTMNTFGLCGKFVIDDEGGTIRLPKYPNYFIAGLANIAPVVGNGKALGFTDGTYTKYTYAARSGNNAWTAQPSFFNSTQGNVGETTNNACEFFSDYKYIGISTDATKSGIEAQINEKQIAGQYFIQVATGSETEDNIINEIELNNPFSLLDYKFSEYELNNLSWLRSNGQYNPKAVYPAVYDLLLKIYNGTETKAGVSVKLSTETFTDYDFVLNTAEETFRLPIKVKLASGKAVVGNGDSIGIGNSVTTTKAGIAYGDYVGTASGYLATIDGGSTHNSAKVSLTQDPTKSGLELSDSDLYLYFYVGETVQNANLINAGRIEEKLADKVDYANTQWVINACMPDYTAGINITSLPYTAPKDGLISIIGRIGNSMVVLKLNDTPMIVVDSTATGNFVRDIRVKKGDVLDKLRVTGTVPYNDSSRSEYSMFYPLKGAN